MKFQSLNMEDKWNVNIIIMIIVSRGVVTGDVNLAYKTRFLGI